MARSHHDQYNLRTYKTSRRKTTVSKQDIWCNQCSRRLQSLQTRSELHSDGSMNPTARVRCTGAIGRVLQP